jgi:hypothetical protein
MTKWAWIEKQSVPSLTLFSRTFLRDTPEFTAPTPAGSREVPPPVGTPVSVGVAEYTRLWTAGTTPADWRWGPQPYGGRRGPAACA